MERFWKAALGVGGLGAIGSFLFWALYKDWLALPIFSRLPPDQTFMLMVIFLVLTFCALLATLVVYLKAKAIDRAGPSPLLPSVGLMNAGLERNSKAFSEHALGATKVIKPREARSHD